MEYVSIYAFLRPPGQGQRQQRRRRQQTKSNTKNKKITTQATNDVKQLKESQISLNQILCLSFLILYVLPPLELRELFYF